MKTAAKVFAIIGIASSVYCIFFSVLSLKKLGIGFLLYGLYALGISIGSLVAINGKSKKAINILAVFNLTVMTIGSIFMFCMKIETPELEQPEFLEEQEVNEETK